LSESTLLEAHLARCGACAREVGQLRRIEVLMRETAVPPPPAELLPALMRRAADGAAHGAPAWTWRDTLRAWPVAMRLAATGSALVAVYLGLLVSGGGGPKAPDAGELAWLWSASFGPVAAAYRGVSR
jgi:anti-sigma factor RsiW